LQDIRGTIEFVVEWANLLPIGELGIWEEYKVSHCAVARVDPRRIIYNNGVWNRGRNVKLDKK